MNKDEVNPILLNLFKETTWGLPWKQILQPKSVILLLRTVCGPALIVACRIKLCTQTWCCSSEMAKVPPNSSDANYAPISSHLQPRASSTAHPPSPHPESHLLALPAFAASSVCHQGVLRNWGCVCVSGRTVTQPLSKATGHLKLGVGGAAINHQKHQQDLGVLPGTCLQGRGDKLTVLLPVHINIRPPMPR